MEIKTCEQYVLAELEKKNAEIERLTDALNYAEDRIFAQAVTIGEFKNKTAELNEVLDELLELINDKVIGQHNYYELSISDYGFEVDKFEFIDGLKKEREPNPEE